MSDEDFLDFLARQLKPSTGSRTFLWPSPGNPGGLMSFATHIEWKKVIGDLCLHRAVPEIVAAKYRRAQKLYFLGWIDADLIKAGELSAVTALELALKDRYGAKVKNKKGKIEFPELLKYMTKNDGLADDRLPTIRRYGGSAIGQLTGQSKPSIADIRNILAHGDPFDGLPWSGLLELVHDLIQYAYRDMIAESVGQNVRA